MMDRSVTIHFEEATINLPIVYEMTRNEIIHFFCSLPKEEQLKVFYKLKDILWEEK